ncbi:hypothetical protein KKC1_08080 [Calderihabitans maritimus]|uniref:Uncharacterized protein n=1 Tax=Calderihabitans maritimus TaxID=1246530 RepID=A0A1Z5HQK0_9FIRM|nr:hypothetical protein KKC1_08080 [Calderihabitans maritimus]
MGNDALNLHLRGLSASFSFWERGHDKLEAVIVGRFGGLN